jgi:putative DNA primase/helicase
MSTDIPPPDDPYEGMQQIGKGRGRKQSSARAPEDDHTPADQDRFLAGRAQNDIGNAERLAARYGEDMMFVPGMGWFGWMGTHWSRELGDDMALEASKKTVKDIWREVASLREAMKAKTARGDEGDRIDYLTQHAVTSGNMGKMKAMIEACQPNLRCELDQLDADPFHLYTPSHALCIHPAEKVISRDRGHRVTKLTKAPFLDGAGCPKWEAFIEQTFPDDGLRGFVQRAAGYSATGDMSEESFFMCWGKGRNGKGTFLRILSYVLGLYAATIPIELLLEGSPKTGNEPSPQFAALAGVRFVMTTEPSMGARFNEGELKTLTGRDTIRIRGLYGTPFDLVPKFKMWIACNDRPTVRSASDAYWRRVKLIPFVTNITEGETNRNLEAELREEASGILNWILLGRADWAERGLCPPEAVELANQSYRDEMDPLQRFLAECTLLEPGGVIPLKRLRSAYEEWCHVTGEEPLKTRTFGMAMTNKGYKKHHSNGTVYQNIALTEHGSLMATEGDARSAAKVGKGW